MNGNGGTGAKRFTQPVSGAPAGAGKIVVVTTAGKPHIARTSELPPTQAKRTDINATALSLRCMVNSFVRYERCSIFRARGLT